MGEIESIIKPYVEELFVEKVNEISMSLENAVKDEVPKKTHLLENSIRIDKRINGLKAIISGYIDGTASYGEYVLFGTSPHDIVAKNAKALKTPYGFFRKVHHPGTKPNDFLGRGLNKVLDMYR